jgi:hypothetical protein
MAKSPGEHVPVRRQPATRASPFDRLRRVAILQRSGQCGQRPDPKGNYSLATTALCSLMNKDTFFNLLSLIWTAIVVAALLYVLFA